MKRLHPASVQHCPECGGLGAIVRREGEFARSERCACVGMCPACNDSGWTTGSDRKATRCACQRLDRVIDRFHRANIPARHHASTRASFKPNTPMQAAVMVGVSRWLEDYEPGVENRGLVLHGAVGRGKTHLMVAMLRELVFRYGVSVRFVEFSHLLADLKSGFDQGYGSARLIDPLVAVDVLAIDELGKGRNTEFEGTVLDELISRRYNAAATILATTNYAPEAEATGRAVGNAAESMLHKGHPDGRSRKPVLADRVGARVHSRLQEMCDFLEVQGSDHRKLQREKRRT